MNEQNFEDNIGPPPETVKPVPPTVFVVDDDPDFRLWVETHLRREGFLIRGFVNGEAALDALPKGMPDMILLDILMPGMSGIETLERIKETHPDCPVIILTAYGTLNYTLNAMRLGAYDFIQKPFDMSRLRVTVRNALRTRDMTFEVRNLREALRNRYSFSKLIGVSRPFVSVLSHLESASEEDSNVLILGESGTGKNLSARAIHYNSPRQEKPFVPVNCAAVSKSTLEADLFGSEITAGPISKKRLGKLERANGGTLLLNDVDQMDLDLQADLCRCLNEGEIPRPGKDASPPIDVRIISTSKKDLRAEADRYGFHKELFTILSGFTIQMPSLSRRKEDIPLLARSFLDEIASHNSVPRVELERGALRALETYRWPGNIRELKNVLSQTFHLIRTDTIRETDLPPSMRDLSPVSAIGAESPDGDHDPEESGHSIVPLRELEERMIREAMEQTQGDIKKTASLLGISRATLYRRLKVMQIT